MEQYATILEGSVCSIIEHTNEQIMDYLAHIGNMTTAKAHKELHELQKSELKSIKWALDNLEKENSKEIRKVKNYMDITSVVHCDLGNEVLTPKSSMTPPRLESKDGKWQIQNICSLAEGNRFYNSSMAMVFKEVPLQSEDHPVLPKKGGTSGDENKWQKAQQMENVPSIPETGHASSPHNPETETREVEPPIFETWEGAFFSPQLVNAEFSQDLYSWDYSNESDQTEMSSVKMHCDELTFPWFVPHQLSELLKEFPFGINNSMSENKLERGGEFIDKVAGGLVEERASTPVKEDRLDGLENVIDSIRISCLDPEGVAKHFPDVEASEYLIRQPCQETRVAMCQDVWSRETPLNTSNCEQGENAETSLANKMPEKYVFCCLLSCFTNVYRRAPKCSCKLPEAQKVDVTSVDSVRRKDSAVLDHPSASRFTIAGPKSHQHEYLSVAHYSQQSLNTSGGHEEKKSNEELRTELTEHQEQEPFGDNIPKLPKSQSTAPKKDTVKRTAFFPREANLKRALTSSKTLSSLNSERNMPSEGGHATQKSKRKRTTAISQKVGTGESLLVKKDTLKTKRGRRKSVKICN
ncbi:retroelement silencing factor 1-like [Ascaphus truei]|uniref:retroelement silencing factor 1-like n=1 Tax=Ascaphus truei TaxID=8439 RepID=UPI003F5A587F